MAPIYTNNTNNTNNTDNTDNTDYPSSNVRARNVVAVVFFFFFGGGGKGLATGALRNVNGYDRPSHGGCLSTAWRLLGNGMSFFFKLLNAVRGSLRELKAWGFLKHIGTIESCIT